MVLETAEQKLGAAISAVGGPYFVSRLSAWLHARIGADNLTVLAWLGTSTPRCLYRSAHEESVHASVETVYCAGGYLLDPFFVLDRSGVKAGIYRLSDIAPDQFSSSEYYISYYKHTKIADEMVYIMHPVAGASVHISLGRDATSGIRFSENDHAIAVRVVPVVEALVAAHWAELMPVTSEVAADADLITRFSARLGAVHGVGLTPRQSETAFLILRGHSSDSAARILGVSPQTVKVFRKQLYARCGISSQAELFVMMMPILASLS